MRFANRLRVFRKMGFDRVALLDIIANEPASGAGIGAWSTAAWRAHDSVQEMRTVLDERIMPGTSVDHFALSIGAVVGGEENLRGAGRPMHLHRGETCYNPQNKTIAANREEMNQNLRTLLANQSAPRFYPYVLMDCRV